MSVYVTDTHPLVWYASGTHRQLSRNVRRVFQAASDEDALIYVPVFVLWEIAMLLKIGRIVINESYGDWMTHLVAQPGYALASVNTQILAAAYAYPFADPFDSVIAATASVMDLPLLTKDMDIINSRLTDIYW